MKDELEGRQPIDQSEYAKGIEAIVLGSILCDKECIHEIASDFDSRLFNDPKHKIISEAMIKLHMRSQIIDLVSVVELIKKNGQLEECGGAVFISRLTHPIATTVNIEYHVRLLQEFWLRKMFNDNCANALLDNSRYEKDIFDIVFNLQKDLEDGLNGVLKAEMSSIADIHNEIIKKSYEYQENNVMSGVPTGLTRLDNLTNGWQPSDLIIVAGRPSMGKTAFAMSVVLVPSIHQKIPVAVFSLEMSKSQLVGRIQSMLSEVNVSKIVKKQLSVAEIDHIDKSCVELINSPLYIDDTANISLLEFKTKSRKLVREKGVKLIIVDYLQLMRSGLRTNNRENEIAEISKGLKAVAKELNVPVIALSQLSRGVEQRGGDKKPALSDLRDSGQIEQDADMVIFAHRPEYYGFNEYDWQGQELDSRNLFMALVLKHRNGIIGEIPLAIQLEFTRVKDHPDVVNYQQQDDSRERVSSTPSFTPMAIGEFSSKNIQPNNDFDSEQSSIFVPKVVLPISITGTTIPNNDFDVNNDLDEIPF